MTSPPRSVPVLRSERLQLVGLEDRHFEGFAQLHADACTMQYIGDGKPLDRVGAWLQMAMLIGHWELRGYGIWAVEDPGTGRFIGRVGLFHPQGWPDPELSWIIAPALRGSGLATEAAGIALHFAFQDLGFERCISLVRPQNIASSRVAAKLGGTVEKTIEFMGGPMLVFRYLPHDVQTTDGG